MRNHALRSSVGDTGGGGGGGGSPIEFVDAAYLSGTTASITVPSHSDGDILLLAATSREKLTLPPLLSGWTNIATSEGDVGGDRRMRVSYIVSDGTITSLAPSDGYYKGVYIFRNAAVGASAATDDTDGAGTSATFPAISPLDVTTGTSWVCGFFFHNIVTITGMTKTTPYGCAYTSEVSSFSATNFTTLTAQSLVVSVELTRL